MFIRSKLCPKFNANLLFFSSKNNVTLCLLAKFKTARINNAALKQSFAVLVFASKKRPVIIPHPFVVVTLL